MTVDKNYCMSSYLTLRYIDDKNKVFAENMRHIDFEPVSPDKQAACDSAEEIEQEIIKSLSKFDLSHAAILLSGGMDSAILASYMPKGTKAYTAKCDTPNAVDETERAKFYCQQYGLEHIVVDITWQDYLDSMDKLMLSDGCPISSNEPQVYKLAQRIKEDGCNLVIIGDNADAAFGGYSELVSRDWKYDDWKKRYTYLDPKNVLKNPVSMEHVFEKYRIPDGYVDYLAMINNEFAVTSTGAYYNAFRNAELPYYDPYAYMKMGKPLDLDRVRSGDSKYHIRDLFRKRYPGRELPEKIAMPRAVDEWMADWKGPECDEFIPGCTEGMTGKQKFQVFALERFLNLIEGKYDY